MVRKWSEFDRLNSFSINFFGIWVTLNQRMTARQNAVMGMHREKCKYSFLFRDIRIFELWKCWMLIGEWKAEHSKKWPFQFIWIEQNIDITFIWMWISAKRGDQFIFIVLVDERHLKNELSYVLRFHFGFVFSFGRVSCWSNAMWKYTFFITESVWDRVSRLLVMSISPGWLLFFPGHSRLLDANQYTTLPLSLYLAHSRAHPQKQKPEEEGGEQVSERRKKNNENNHLVLLFIYQ